MKINFKSIFRYFIAVLGFIIVSLAYFNPVLQGKKIYQSDIAQYVGMAKEIIDYRKEAKEETYWTNRGFAGMPTYLLGAKYPHHYIKKIDTAIRFLPRPADYLFLYFLGFFVLLTVLKIDPLLAFVGSLAFGFSTYFIIILGVGHNAKAHAIGYMPLMLAGILLVFKKKYIRGGLLFCLAMALELVANHYQMTYYFMIMLAIIAGVYLFKAIKENQIKSFITAATVLIVGLVLAVAMNATSILATKEYSAFSTRGKSEITIDENGNPKETRGLDKSYILSYSYGILETLNLMVPRFMGGSNSENLGKDAAIVKELVKMGHPYKSAKEIAKSGPGYWGEQPYVGAPAYIGVTIIFLFVLGLFTYSGYKKNWVIITVLTALALSWGKNLNFLSDLFINYFPLYNKFRAVTSIQVLIELCVPLFAIYTLFQFFKSKIPKASKLKQVYKATAITGGIILIFLLFKGTLLSFTSSSDRGLLEGTSRGFYEALKEDRARIFTNDAIRSLALILAIAAVLWGFLKKKVSKQIAVIALGLLFLIDLIPVAWRYVNTDNFVRESQITGAFKPTKVDRLIKNDTTHYRVYDITSDPFNSARAPYFHNALGGYHAAKPQRMQHLYDFYLSKGNESILNMLNVKYFIFSDKEGRAQVQQNETALGNAWFIDEVTSKQMGNEELLSLKDLEVSNKAIVSENEFISNKKYVLDSLASIQLKSYKPNELKYISKNTNKGFAVFSEIYYANGWQALVDGVSTPILKTNYALRGIEIPSGNHSITFKFESQVVKTGSTITLIASILFVILSVFGIRYIIKES